MRFSLDRLNADEKPIGIITATAKQQALEDTHEILSVLSYKTCTFTATWTTIPADVLNLIHSGKGVIIKKTRSHAHTDERGKEMNSLQPIPSERNT